jgi:hypothetical protein
MRLFCFASRNLENIRRGVQAKRWAVATVSDTAMRTRVTKARNYFSCGSRGLLYCAETHSFLVPFVTTSEADPRAVVTDIWPEPWVLPFSIDPLGDESRQMKADLAKVLWPILKDCGPGGVTAAMNATGATVFSPLEVTEGDWELIMNGLSTRSLQNVND